MTFKDIINKSYPLEDEVLLKTLLNTQVKGNKEGIPCVQPCTHFRSDTLMVNSLHMQQNAENWQKFGVGELKGGKRK